MVFPKGGGSPQCPWAKTAPDPWRIASSLGGRSALDAESQAWENGKDVEGHMNNP